MGEHLAQDLGLDRARSYVDPPPAVIPHGLGGRLEAVGHGREILLRIVEAEDDAARADPAQSQTLGAEVILQHPAIARGLRVADAPDRGHVCDPNGQALLRQSAVQVSSTAVPRHLEVFVARLYLRRIQPRQELVHGSHDIRVRIESTARKAHVRWPILPVALHEVPPAADNADWQAAPQGLAIGYKIGPDPEIFLGTAGCQAKAQKHLIKNEWDVPLGADLAQLAKPVGVGRSIKV